jgi:hypothetical protein
MTGYDMTQVPCYVPSRLPCRAPSYRFHVPGENSATHLLRLR